MTTHDDVYAGLTEILSDVFLRDDLVATPDLSAHDVEGWDSFKQIEIILAAQDRWHIKLRSQDLDTLQTLGDLATIISRALSALRK